MLPKQLLRTLPILATFRCNIKKPDFFHRNVLQDTDSGVKMDATFFRNFKKKINLD